MSNEKKLFLQKSLEVMFLFYGPYKFTEKMRIREEEVFRNCLDVIIFLKEVFNTLEKVTDCVGEDAKARVESTSELLECPEAIPILLYAKNNSLLYSVYILVSKSLNVSSTILMRSIVENITFIYFISFTDPKTKKYYCLYSSRGEKPLSEEVEKTIRRDYKWFSPSYVRSKLYEGDKLEAVKTGYGIISEYAHPGIKYLAEDWWYIPRRTREKLDHLLSLIHANLEALLLTQHSWLRSPTKKKIITLMLLLGLHIKDLDGIIDLKPNKPPYSTKLVPLESFFDSNLTEVRELILKVRKYRRYLQSKYKHS